MHSWAFPPPDASCSVPSVTQLHGPLEGVVAGSRQSPGLRRCLCRQGKLHTGQVLSEAPQASAGPVCCQMDDQTIPPSGPAGLTRAAKALCAGLRCLWDPLAPDLKPPPRPRPAHFLSYSLHHVSLSDTMNVLCSPGHCLPHGPMGLRRWTCPRSGQYPHPTAVPGL